MSEIFDNGVPYAEKLDAARVGCGQCNGPLTIPPSGPAGDPFLSGPWRGRYLCSDCWTLYYNEHPEHLADRATIEFIRREAEQIKVARITKDQEVLFSEGKNSVILSSNGTVVFKLERPEGMAPEEYDAARFELLARAMLAVADAKIAGFSIEFEKA